MIDFLKNSLKVFAGYCISLLIFLIFLPGVLVLARENYTVVIAAFSFFAFILTAAIIYTDMKKIGEKENRPIYNLNPHPLKGFVLGLAGFSPFMLLMLAYPFITFDSEVLNRLKHVTLNALLGPLWGFIRLGGESVPAYAVSALIVPTVAMLGYMAGHWRFEFMLAVKKFLKKKQQQ